MAKKGDVRCCVRRCKIPFLPLCTVRRDHSWRLLRESGSRHATRELSRGGRGHSLNNAPEKRGMVVAQRGAVCAEEMEAKLISLSGGGPREIAAQQGNETPLGGNAGKPRQSNNRRKKLGFLFCCLANQCGKRKGATLTVAHSLSPKKGSED